MKVTIKGNTYDFVSDFPKEWQYTSGDFFKFPVLVGNTKCFIKRFDKRQLGNNPGSQLLFQLKQLKEPNLPEVYDIVEFNEQGTKGTYVFYEYLPGRTLKERLLDNQDIRVQELCNDLFEALGSLDKFNFWHPDFSEKNIFIDNKSKVFLLDLDSAQSSSKYPENNIFSTKPSWQSVSKYYTEVLNLEEEGVFYIPGIAINYLQLIFLSLRVKSLVTGGANDRSNFPAGIDPSFNELFKKIYRKGSHLPASAYADDLKELILQKIIITSTKMPSSKTSTPEIVSFESTQMSVGKNESFELRWEVEQAESFEIYKNGTLIEKLDASVNSLTLHEYYDGTDRDVVYSLVALNASGKTKSSPLLVRIIDKPHSPSPVQSELSFSSSSSVVKKSETFVLHWNSNNTDHFELYRNGVLFKTLESNINSLETSEFYDGKTRDIEYSLLAIYADGHSKRENITVSVVDKTPVHSKSQVDDELPVAGETLEQPEPVITNEPDNYYEASVDTDGTASLSEPVVISFSASIPSVHEGDKFTLSWNVESAAFVEIYKNGNLLKKLTNGETNIELFGYTEKNSKNLVFELSAVNDVATVKSNPVQVEIVEKMQKPIHYNDPRKLKAYMIGGVVLLVLLAAVGIFTYQHFAGHAVLNSFTPDSIIEGHTLRLYGKNLPLDTNEFQILFNNVKKNASFSDGKTVFVEVPDLGDNLGNNSVDVAIIYKNDTIHVPKKLIVTRTSIGSQAPLPSASDQDTIINILNEATPIKKSQVIAVVKPKRDSVAQAPQPQVEEAKIPKPKVSIYDLVTVTSNEYKTGLLGGVKDLKLTVKNISPFILDQVDVSISYQKKNEREVNKGKIVFKNVPANDSSVQDIPKSKRGSKITFNISEIKSKQYEADLKQQKM